MRGLAVLFLLLLCGMPASAQEVTADTQKDFWCGVALDLASRDVPADAAPEVHQVVGPYKAGAQMLLGRARSAHLEAGYTDEAFAALEADKEQEIIAQLSAT